MEQLTTNTYILVVARDPRVRKSSSWRKPVNLAKGQKPP
jgi:hypothetical protein